ncbi:MAG TPA: uroporphyrinogen decarboxylase family protein [bacterium]|nr:uroporphyrinogen decarboxylase family protein [bacterium]HPG46234.1 uroporphyrinogen decarboxylase family protein [bacterium]HPM98572.1 uroporphyrinogen decarboxylase family protein [bacterium]
MTSVERWQAVLHGKTPDRLPCFFNATAEAEAKLMRHLAVDSHEKLLERLHIDRVATVTPRYVGPPLAADATVFGARFQNIPYAGGVYSGIDGVVTHHPLAAFSSVEEIEENYTWPSPDWWEYKDLTQQVENKEGWILIAGGSEPFMDYKEQLRGTEQAFVDLIQNPEIVHYCLEKLYHLCYENTRRIYESLPGRIFGSWVAEDMGTQESLLYSPTQIRDFFFPHMKRMIDLVHGFGGVVFHHSDGAIRPLIPELIDLGIDVLNPIQWRCAGMDREGLARDFAGKVVFHGGVDNQFTLAFGNPEQVKEEVRDNTRILGAHGGYIVGPCHKIQVISPPENVVALYEAVNEMNA